MHQTRNKIKSTKPQETMRQDQPPMKLLAQCTNRSFTKIIDHKRQISIELTEKLPVTSKRFNKYLLVLYEYDSNIIMVCPRKSRIDSEFIRIFKYLHEHLLTRLIKPAYMILDNEEYTVLQR